MKRIILAGGCFWGVEAFFKRIQGVLSTRVGYANGKLPNPTYERVCTGSTGYVEVCDISYNEEKLPLEILLKSFWKIIDPTLLNRQGNDRGSQYRTGIYYTDPADLPTIEKSLLEEEKKHNKPIVTEVEPLLNFYPAEEYHQDYLTKNPGGYCHISLE